MPEHTRTEKYQWVDSQLCMVIDKVTGKPEKFTAGRNAIGSLKEALDYVANSKGWEKREIIEN